MCAAVSEPEFCKAGIRRTVCDATKFSIADSVGFAVVFYFDALTGNLMSVAKRFKLLMFFDEGFCQGVAAGKSKF